MKKIETAKLTSINGGWAKYGDWNLPVERYSKGLHDVRQYTGSYNNGWGGKVAYIVYWRPDCPKYHIVAHKFRTA